MTGTTVHQFRRWVAERPDVVAMRLLASGGAMRDEALTWGAWSERVDRLATALISYGFVAGERAAVFAGNDLLWPVADLAILSAGGVSVGAYPTSTPEQLHHMLGDAEVRLVLVDTRERCERVIEIRDRLPALRSIVCAEGGVAGAESLDAWAEGDGRRSEHEAELEMRRQAIRPDDPAVIVYTSGSTGTPKGAVLSHRYLAASADSIARTLGLTSDDSTLSFLPYAHASERVFGLHTRIGAGVAAGVVPDPQRLWEAAADYQPTVFGAIPRIYEKAAERLADAGEILTGAERERWERAVVLGRQRSRLRQAGSPVPASLESEWRECGPKLFEEAAAIFGGGLRLASSGGAPLPRRSAELLDAAGVTVLGAYGLTEHLCVAFNRAGRYTFDTAGLAMPGTEIRIAIDGEILVRRSALTFSGYLSRPEDTSVAFTEDGEWLRTGDLGALTEEGFLRITGRKKELIALSTGKKVAPAPIEVALARHPRVSQAVVCGEGRKFLTALVFLRGSGDGDGSLDGPICTDPAVVQEISEAVGEANAGRPRFEQVGRFLVVGRDLSEGAGEITETMKVRRDVVAEHFRDRLDTLYGEEGG